MGDRCYLTMRVHADDVDSEGWQQWLRNQGESEMEDIPGEWVAEEANYALQVEREELAKAGVRFAGYHESGDSYDSGIFHSLGDGELQQYDTDENASLTIRISLDQTKEQILAEATKAQAFLRNHEAIEREIAKSWVRHADRRTDPSEK